MAPPSEDVKLHGVRRLHAARILPYSCRVPQREEAGSFLIENGEIVLPDRVIRNGSLLAEGAKILSTGPAQKMPFPLPAGCRRIDAKGAMVCPALWEQHIHGCGGISTERMSARSLSEMAGFLARRGIGAFLPTTVPHEESLVLLGEAIDGTTNDPGVRGRIPGISVEGPFVSLSHRGAIPEGLLRLPSLDYLQRMIDLTRGHMKMLTYAPELPNAWALVDKLGASGVIPFLGHSGAALADMAGYESVSPLGVTHLWNGMSGVSHKEPGLAHWALLDRHAFTEINCDGTHVDDAAVQLVLRARPWEKLIIISDAIAPAGASPGTTRPTLYGKPLVGRGSGLYYQDTGVLVGSQSLVPDCLARLVHELNVPLASAVSMATLNPARLLGCACKGALLPGYDADIAILDRDFSHCSFLSWEGKPVFEER